MKTYFKKSIIFLLNLLIYFIPSIFFRSDTDFYNSLKGSFVPPIVFIIAWTIIFLILSFVNTFYFFKRKDLNKKDYLHYVIITGINYVCILLYPLCFFVLNNLMASYIVTILCTVSCVIMVIDSLILDKKITIALLPYLAWTLFASFLSIMIYLKN